MAQSTINRLKEAELSSAKAKESAGIQAERIISDARLEADRIIADATSKAHAVCDEQISIASSKSHRFLQEKNKASEQSGQTLFDCAIKKQQQVNDIVKSFLA